MWEPGKDITPWGSKISDSKETSQGRKGRKPQLLPSVQELGWVSPAHSALLMCALLDWVRHFESSMYNILMSREELVSQKSLKYDHM